MKIFSRKLTIISIVLLLTSCKKDEKKIDLSIDSITTNNLIKDIIEEINNNYANEITKEKLEIAAINGMLGYLDEHSTYITQDEFDAFYKMTRGSFLGVGIEIKKIKEGIEISSIINNSPSFLAGLKIGDIITKIDDVDTLKMPIKKVVAKLSSDYNRKIKITVIRNKNEIIDFNIKKSVIQLQSVKHEFISDIALIKVNYFNETTVNDISKVIKKIIKNKSTGLILDLRNNTGGILEESINVCDLFLSNKKIIEFRSKNSEESKEIFSDEIDLLNGLPMAVLVDKNSASGAELVACALSENKRAILIGEKTFGKGSMQTIIPIPGRGAIKLTTSHFFSPNGNEINKKGVLPDIEIQKEDNSINDQIVLRAMDLLHGISALNN